MATSVRLLVGTRKGAFTLHSDATRRSWTLRGPMFLGQICNHIVRDPRDGRTMLAAAHPGHLGPNIFRSRDNGRTWNDVSAPPKFEPTEDPDRPKRVEHVFALVPGHPSQPDVWYAGTSPQGLFRSDDGGDTWQGVTGFNHNPMYRKWAGRPEDAPPDGLTLHSILIDPRDPAHLYIGMSGGVFESRDAGASWAPLNKGIAGDFLPDPNAEYGHDPHCVQLHPTNPDRLYQQNHCGIYRLDRPSTQWERIGDNMPRRVGDIGFPITMHPQDPDTAWVFPMDGSTVWPRVSPGGKPAVYVTRNAGKSWKRQDKGFPTAHGWFTVLRQAMTIDAHDPHGLYIGTTNGEIWGSRNEGASWTCLARHLPRVLSVELG